MEIVGSILSTITVSIITAIFAVYLAMRRFRADKWWERKHESYTRLLQVIHRMVRNAETHLDDSTGERGMTQEEKRHLEEDWKVLHREYCEVRDLADFDLSSEAVESLGKFDAARISARNNEDVYVWISQDLEASKRCLADIKSAARRDLRVG